MFGMEHEPRRKGRHLQVEDEGNELGELTDVDVERRDPLALNQRQRRILELVPRQGFVSIEALSKHFRGFRPDHPTRCQ